MWRVTTRIVAFIAIAVTAGCTGQSPSPVTTTSVGSTPSTTPTVAASSTSTAPSTSISPTTIAPTTTTTVPVTTTVGTTTAGTTTAGSSTVGTSTVGTTTVATTTVPPTTTSISTTTSRASTSTTTSSVPVASFAHIDSFTPSRLFESCGAQNLTVHGGGFGTGMIVTATDPSGRTSTLPSPQIFNITSLTSTSFNMQFVSGRNPGTWCFQATSPPSTSLARCMIVDATLPPPPC
jgi:hypothetical protein